MSTATDTRAPGRRYRFDDHGQQGNGFAGDFVLKPVSFVKKYTPTFGKMQQTVARILPVRNPENINVWENYRIDTGTGTTWGDWIRGYQVCRMGEGDQSVSFITHDPVDRDHFDPMQSPGWVLYNAVNRRVNAKQDPGWGGYLKGGEGRGAALAPPKLCYFTNTLLLQHSKGPCNPIIGLADDGVATILQISKAAGETMLSRAEQYQGDLVALNQGGFVTFYSKEDGDPRQRGQGGAASWQNAAQQGGGKKDIGFDCFIEPTYNGLPADVSQFESTFARKTFPWESFINIPTVEQQAHWLADRLPPDMIVYAFQGFPEWIPEQVRQKAAAAQSFQMPGAPWMGGGGGMLPPGAIPPGVLPPGLQLSQPAQQGWGAPSPVSPPQQTWGAPQQPPQDTNPVWTAPPPGLTGLPTGQNPTWGQLPATSGVLQNGPVPPQTMTLPTSAQPTGWGQTPSPGTPPFDTNPTQPATQPQQTLGQFQQPAFGQPPQQTFTPPSQPVYTPPPGQPAFTPPPAATVTPTAPPTQMQLPSVPPGTAALGPMPTTASPADTQAMLQQLRGQHNRT